MTMLIIICTRGQWWNCGKGLVNVPSFLWAKKPKPDDGNEENESELTCDDTQL